MRYDFNKQLADTSRRYTFFAPQDSAWETLHVHQPSVYKKMFMSDFAYHVSYNYQYFDIIKENYLMEVNFFRQSKFWKDTLW